MNLVGQQFQPAIGSFVQQQPRLEQVCLPMYLVQNINAIQPGDVSGDGNPNFFVTKDLSCICVKMLNNKGLIDTGIYVLQTAEPIVQPNAMQTQQATTSNAENNVTDILQQVLSRMDEIENRLDKQSKPYNYKKQNYQNKSKKGESNNGD